MKNRSVWECEKKKTKIYRLRFQSNLLLVRTVGRLWSQNCFFNNFFTRIVQTKIQNVYTCTNDEQSNGLES